MKKIEGKMSLTEKKMKHMLGMLGGIAGSFAVLTGCSQVSNQEAVEIEETSEITEPESTDTEKTEETAVFRPGSWIVDTQEDVYTYYFFDEDGVSGSMINQETEMGIAFTYETTGNQAIFYMGAVDNPVPATIEVTDEEYVTIIWDEGDSQSLRWLSDETEDEFLYGAESGMNSDEDIAAEEYIGFKPGVWLSYGAGEYRYFFFHNDGETVDMVDQQTGDSYTQVYEFSDAVATFAEPGWLNPAPANIEIIDDEHFELKWEEGILEELSYIYPDVDTFEFYTDQELCDMALTYYAMTVGENVEGMMAAAATNEDGTVSIQIYQNLGDHNSTADYYTVDRQVATGTDIAGNSIDLTEALE